MFLLDDGDVQLRTDNTPLIFVEGKFRPICGHFFWDDKNGVNLFCRKLGYMTGKITAKRLQIDDDAVQIGKCISGAESFSQCGIGSCTPMEVGGTKQRHCRCRAGEKAGFRVTCSGGKLF